MIKNVNIVSLSSGVLGESFIKHELDLGIKRLKELGLEVEFGKNALKGMEFIKNNPNKRAEDLIEAFESDKCDMILCAIGGDDTFRLAPYLFENDKLKKVIKNKIFLGFSDTTVNHFMLYKLGLNTFYGQAFLSDICELEDDMLPYSRQYFEELIKTSRIKEIRPSDVWYQERENFSPSQLGVKRISHINKGFELLQGPNRFSGKIIGGCLESMFEMICGSKNSEQYAICSKYKLFPDADDFKGKILLIETSEEKSTPEKFENMLKKLKETNIFSVVNGVIFGKPIDEVYYEEYKKILIETVNDKNLPILYNFNVGHACPRCIVPFNVQADIDAEKQVISFKYD